MVYRGQVKDGRVVFEGQTPPEGARVLVDVEETVSVPIQEKTLSEKLLEFSGKIKGYPSDFAKNHDHYIHGVPKE